MKLSLPSNLSLALIHHPVKDKNGVVIASAVTNLDLHDIARAARTYGAGPFYVVTPLYDQKDLVRRITAHWKTGPGAFYNPARKRAIQLIEVVDSLEAAKSHLTEKMGVEPEIVATCAKSGFQNTTYEVIRKNLEIGQPQLLLFGTAWGLADVLLEHSDYILPPICGNTDYNHLSVRSAASIILDRLLGPARV